MSALAAIYQHLPAPLRSVAATMWGYYLRSWRRGPATERLIEEALDRDRWSAARWSSWLEERRARILHDAATRVPFYRDAWTRRRAAGDRASWELIENWPVLRKDDLREHPEMFLADGCDRRRMLHEHTSGTTGKPLNLWFSRATVRTWYALYEARTRRWYGLDYGDRWVNIGGQQVVPFKQTTPPFWVWNAAFRQLYMSSYHLSSAFIEAYVEALRRYEIDYILGYSSSLYSLASLGLERGLAFPRLRVAITNAEPLYAHQREAMSAAFGGAVRETYGMSELACAASECDRGRRHIWPDVGMIEILSDTIDTAEIPGKVGRIVGTGFLNENMPLIRYEVGDRGSLEAEPSTCACGRSLPVLASVEGRLDDVLVTRDGRRIGRLDPVFKSDLPIREAQILQDSVDLVRIRIVPADGFTPADGSALADRLRERMGDIEVIVEQVDHIERTRNGKFRAVISRCASTATG